MQQLALVQRVGRMRDGSAERRHSGEGAGDRVCKGGARHAGEGAPGEGRSKAELPAALSGCSHDQLCGRHEGQQTHPQARPVVTVTADHEGGGESAR